MAEEIIYSNIFKYTYINKELVLLFRNYYFEIKYVVFYSMIS
jgi:hypothetical protein